MPSSFCHRAPDFGRVPLGTGFVTLILLGDPSQSLAFTLCSGALALVRAQLSLVGRFLAVIRDAVALVGDAIPHVGDALASGELVLPPRDRLLTLVALGSAAV